MVKIGILIVSVVSLVQTVAEQLLKDELTSINHEVSTLVTVGLWITILIMVAIDVKKNHNRNMWTVLTVFLGGIGGLAYAVAAEDGEVDEEEEKKQTKTNFKNAAIFNYIIAGLLLMFTLITLTAPSVITIILLVLAIGFFFLGRYMWKK